MCKYSGFLLKNIFERTLKETSINLTVITTIINNERKKQPNDFLKKLQKENLLKLIFKSLRITKHG